MFQISSDLNTAREYPNVIAQTVCFSRYSKKYISILRFIVYREKPAPKGLCSKLPNNILPNNYVISKLYKFLTKRVL